MPSYPQFNKNSLLFGEEAKDAGDDSNEAILNRAIESVKNRETQFAIEDPDLRKNHPKTLFVWRSNLISSSAKGQEYFMKHLLGTRSGLMVNLTKKTNQKKFNGVKIQKVN